MAVETNSGLPMLMLVAGGVLSMLTVAVVEAEFPALSEHVPVTVCPAPSFVKVVGPE